MGEKFKLVRYIQRCLLLSCLLISLIFSTSFAQDSEIGMDQNLTVSTTLLSIAATVKSEKMSISYNGLSGGSGLLFQMDTNRYGLGPLNVSEPDFKQQKEEDSPFKIGKTLKQISRYLLRYFNVNEHATDAADSKSLLKNKASIDKTNPNNFEFNLSLNIGSCNDTFPAINAVQMESYWLYTYVNAVYHYEKNEVELGFSNDYLNDFLLEGMKLELLANPGAGSGALFLTMSL